MGAQTPELTTGGARFLVGPLVVELHAAPSLAGHVAAGDEAEGPRDLVVSLTERTAGPAGPISRDGFDELGLLEGASWTLHRRVAPSAAERVDGTCVASRTAVLHSLRFATQPALLRRGWTLVHAASVLVDDGVHVFAGPSGIGKTTLVRAVVEAGGELFGDEVALLGPGECAVHPGQPWSGVVGRRARFAAFHLLARDGAARPLTAAEGVRALLSLAMVYERDPESGRLALEAATRIMEGIPADRLVLPSLESVAVYARRLAGRGA